MLTLYRCHLASCKHREKGRKHRSCQCPLWVEGTLRGEHIRRSLDMRSWDGAQDLLREWESRGPKSALMTVEDAIEKFLEDALARRLSGATIGKQKVLLARLKTFARDTGVRYVSQLGPDEIRTFRASWKDSAVTAAKNLERLRSFFRFCTSMKWVDENPAEALRAPRFHQTPTLPFTDEEWGATLEAVEKYPTQNSYGGDNRARLRAFLLLLRYSGLRIRDVVCLLRDRIKDGKLMLYTQKTGQAVFVPLPPVVTEALDACGDRQLPFWSGSGNPKSAVADWQRSLRRLFKLAGVENGHAHRFRDTFAVRLLEKGVPLESVAVLLGNSLRIAEKHYAPWVRSRQVALEDVVRRAWTDTDVPADPSSSSRVPTSPQAS
jgi:site-specific recombinase XerD